MGTKGVYAIETKTYSKPHADTEVQYDGERVVVPGVKLDRDPVRQVTAIAKWVQELIDDTCGLKCRVRPVVLFPGWHVQKMPRPLPPVWVMSGKELHVFVGNEPDVLKPEDAKLVASRISRHMRTED